MSERNILQGRLPRDAVLAHADSILPLIEVVEDRRVLIEHHRGLVAYGDGEICVRVSFGRIQVCGHGLRLARMTKDQLVICGRIQGIYLQRQGR